MKRGDSDPNEPRAPYICEQCGQSYSRRDTLRNHIKKRHSGIPEGDFFCPGKLLRFKLVVYVCIPIKVVKLVVFIYQLTFLT